MQSPFASCRRFSMTLVFDVGKHRRFRTVEEEARNRHRLPARNR
jgi:hypothetical protein